MPILGRPRGAGLVRAHVPGVAGTLYTYTACTCAVARGAWQAHEQLLAAVHATVPVAYPVEGGTDRAARLGCPSRPRTVIGPIEALGSPAHLAPPIGRLAVIHDKATTTTTTRAMYRVEYRAGLAAHPWLIRNRRFPRSFGCFLLPRRVCMPTIPSIAPPFLALLTTPPCSPRPLFLSLSSLSLPPSHPRTLRPAPRLSLPLPRPRFFCKAPAVVGVRARCRPPRRLATCNSIPRPCNRPGCSCPRQSPIAACDANGNPARRPKKKIQPTVARLDRHPTPGSMPS